MFPNFSTVLVNVAHLFDMVVTSEFSETSSSRNESLIFTYSSRFVVLVEENILFQCAS